MSQESDRARIEREIRDAIRAGEYRPGQELPSAARLAIKYGVSQRTAASALATLKGEGLVTARQGRGHYVASDGQRRPHVPSDLEWRRQIEERLERLERERGKD